MPVARNAILLELSVSLFCVITMLAFYFGSTPFNMARNSLGVPLEPDATDGAKVEMVMFLMKRTTMRQPADETDDDDNDDAAAAAAADDDDDDDAPDEFSKDFLVHLSVRFASLLNLAACNLLSGEKMLRRHISIFWMPQSRRHMFADVFDVGNNA